MFLKWQSREWDTWQSVLIQKIMLLEYGKLMKMRSK